MSDRKRSAEPGGAGSPSKPDPKKGKLPIIGSAGALPSPDGEAPPPANEPPGALPPPAGEAPPLGKEVPDDPPLTANETLSSGDASSDPIENSSQTQQTQPLPTSVKHIHGAELSEEVRRACIEVDKELAHFQKLSALPRGKETKKLAKAAIRAKLENLGVGPDVRTAAILICDARIDEYAKAPSSCLASFFGPCPCCPFSDELWNPSAPGPSSQPASKSAPVVTASPGYDPDILAILRDPKTKNALTSLPNLIESLQGLSALANALPIRTAAVEQAQDSLADRMRQAEESITSLSRSRTSLLANFDAVSNTVTASTEHSTLINDSMERAELTRVRNEASRTKEYNRATELHSKLTELHTSGRQEEHSRKLAEEERAQAEAQRVILVARITESEQHRSEQEENRLTAEGLRVQEEQRRSDAEITRAQNEELRVSREKNRAENYVARTFLPGPGSSSGLNPSENPRSAPGPSQPHATVKPPTVTPAPPPAWSRTPFVQPERAVAPPVFPPPALFPRPSIAPPPAVAPSGAPPQSRPPSVPHRPPGTELYPAPRAAILPTPRFPGRSGPDPYSQNPAITSRSFMMVTNDEARYSLLKSDEEVCELWSQWGLDDSRRKIVNLVRPGRDGGRAVAVVLADDASAASCADRIKILTSGRPDTYFLDVSIRKWDPKPQAARDSARNVSAKSKVDESARAVLKFASSSGRLLLSQLKPDHRIHGDIKTWLEELSAKFGYSVTFEELLRDFPDSPIIVAARQDLDDLEAAVYQAPAAGHASGSVHPPNNRGPR